MQAYEARVALFPKSDRRRTGTAKYADFSRNRDNCLDLRRTRPSRIPDAPGDNIDLVAKIDQSLRDFLHVDQLAAEIGMFSQVTVFSVEITLRI